MTIAEINRLEQAISKAEKYARQYADTPDTGSCNFDTPTIRVKATARQLAGMDWRVFKLGRRQPDGSQWFEIDIDLEGQAARRTRMAKAAAESLCASGYTASVHHVLD